MSATTSKSRPVSAYPDVRALLRLALEEDVGPGDIATEALAPPRAAASATVRARQPLVVCGLDPAAWVFRRLAPRARIRFCLRDGDRAAPGDALLQISGPARALLTAERTALNLLQRLSGIATLTASVVDRLRGAPVALLDTRKTTPGLRRLEKYAVKCGGGTNHRFGLHDAVLIKDNHLAYRRGSSLADAVRAARKAAPRRKIEIEVDTLDQLADALRGNPDWVLLDNMPPPLLRKAVALCRGRCKTEASGGITPRTIAAYARTGVTAISLGALTHSATAVDIALDFD